VPVSGAVSGATASTALSVGLGEFAAPAQRPCPGVVGRPGQPAGRPPTPAPSR
jgi:hypothetical protein